MSWVRPFRIASVLALVVLGASGTAAQNAGSSGLTKPVVLAPFAEGQPRCNPPGLAPALHFIQDNRRKFMDGVGYGLARAAADRGLSYENPVAHNDAATMVALIEAARAARVGAVVIAPVDSRSSAASLTALIAQGSYVAAVVPPPAVTILNAPQYLTGRTIAEAAADHIRGPLGGNANVVLLTHDSLQFLAPRFTAMRDVLRELPGARIIADISPRTVDEAGGYATMKVILTAHPDIDVVLGADTVVLGALRAVREAGRVRPDQFFGGIDGEPDAIEEIRSADSPYRATVSLASPIFGYALGQFAADWLEGAMVPQAVDILPSLLTNENLGSYEADTAAPEEVWNDPTRRAAYLRMYGGICFDTREQFLNFPWSSEG